ncbi:LLM class flavin-dependent oxidoreductase [Georgenia sp. SYP-B2076]|uniref:LLM class flavin-dependent oxidoreductase n=1 Tax=Georgenia sp. SYP-B2076 TaxID=2495881 RepID=UPI000F8F10CB|nr:LLM class flavin-dependent oxidoreductase [Georgenia sp. SYP-B2076]
MTDYGHDLIFGSFLTPGNADPAQVVALAKESERAGLDLVTFQDHPYQPGFLDTWTLLSYVAAQTERIHVSANVLNLPLRPPAVLARAAASLDLLSGGRFEMGLGAGAFWDGIAAMGGPRLAPGQAVDALGEAIDIIRGIWAPSAGQTLTVEGRFHSVRDAARGPAPAHDIGIWLGAYKPRMLRLTGRRADGWLPSIAYLKTLTALTDGNAIIDEAAANAGRDPAAIRRILNIGGRFGPTGRGLFEGPPEEWVDQLAALTLGYGFSGYILGTDDPGMIARFGEEVAPAVRDLVAAERATTGPAPEGTRPTLVTAPGRGGAMRPPSPAHADAAMGTGIDYAAIPELLAGKTFTPRDAGFDDVRSTYMAVGRPGLVIMAEDADDVSAAVTFASAQEVPLSVRSGGHGIAGLSTNDGGIVIDVSRLDAIDILDPQTRRFRVGPGATWGHIAETLGARGWAMTSGNYGDVGAGGLATAGGIGYLVREHGLTVDHVVAAELVLADGTQVRADASTNPDLFWAVRGAGASMGIVTALELDALELGNVVVGTFTYDATATADFLLRWSRYMAAAPRELTSFMFVSPAQAGQGATAQAINVWANDDVDAAVAALEPMLRLAPVIDQRAQVAPYGALVPPGDSRHAGQQRTKIRNGFISHVTEGDAEALAVLLHSGTVAVMEVRSVGGAMNDVDATATAFAHRTQEVFVSVGTPPELEDALDAAWSVFSPHVSGMYGAYSSDTTRERAHEAYPGATYERLAQIKRRYDPANLFRRGLTVEPGRDEGFAVGSAGDEGWDVGSAGDERPAAAFDSVDVDEPVT